MRRYDDQKGKAEPFRPWKPERCHDCGAPHPSFSRDGMAGPWRCGPCDKLASPKPKDDPFAEPAKPTEPPQGRLL
jgi:hypothetical protein